MSDTEKARFDVMAVFTKQYDCYLCKPDYEESTLILRGCVKQGYCAKAADDEHDPIAIEAVIKNLHPSIRHHLQHIYRNRLQDIVGSIEVGTKEESQAAVARLVVDLQRMGI